VLRRLHLALLKIYKRLPRRGRLAIVHALAPSYTVGAICIIERDDTRLLLVRHSYRNAWGFPGGLLNRGEGPVDGAVREVMEECGIVIEIVGEPAVVVAPEPRRVDVVYRCRTEEPDRVRAIPPEVTQAAWFLPDELPELQHEAAGALVALARVTGTSLEGP
jgi:ADP-ribose pyrophosphatase YjhB (NUDIX family)